MADLAVYPLGDETFAVQDNVTGRFLKDGDSAMLVFKERSEAEQAITDFNNPDKKRKVSRSTATATASNTEAATGAAPTGSKGK